MFSSGQWTFVIFFVITFIIVITISYRKDKLLHKKHYKGAMVVDDDHTFHFYRMNKDSSWSHKPGTNKVINYGEKKKIVTVEFPYLNFGNNNIDKPINGSRLIFNTV